MAPNQERKHIDFLEALVVTEDGGWTMPELPLKQMCRYLAPYGFNPSRLPKAKDLLDAIRFCNAEELVQTGWRPGDS
jgi:hypothetical protein